MKHILSLIIIGVAGFKIAQSFINPENATAFLGMEMNVWGYRIIWASAAVISGFSIMRGRNKDANK
jgi:hypothetical protein